MIETYLESNGLKMHAPDENSQLQEILNELRPQLPIQNPIPFFVHNNPLMYWEKYKFEEGIVKSALLYERAGIQLDRGFIREFEDIVIPVLSGYMDQGLRRWNLPTNFNLWNWFCHYVDHTSSFKSPSFAKLKKDSKKWLIKDSAVVVLCEMLKQRIPNPKERPFYIKSLLFHFKGWSGMVHLFETKPELYPLHQKEMSLIDWLAILVTVESKINPSAWNLDTEERHNRREHINFELNSIKAKERAFYSTVLGQFKNRLADLKSTLKSPGALPYKKNALAQVFLCIDDREESFRRAIEEVNPGIETYGTVGFFGVDVAIKSADQLIFQPYCPPVIQPRKKAVEKVIQNTRSWIADRKHLLPAFNHTRFTLFEPVATLFGPLFYLLSLFARSSDPRIYDYFKKKITNPPSKEDGFGYEFVPGFEYTVSEKAKIVLDILKSAGLKNNFSSLVVMMAHGASTTNNPFQKSYGCGACSGQSGFPNAKIFCSFANDNEIRSCLRQMGYAIPDETLFLPAHHDTCSDEVHIHEIKGMSPQQVSALKQLRLDLNHALKKNTEIRFKRFGISLNESPAQRSLDWSQPRPEYGHSNVALAVFGPRVLTEGFDLDRRAFLISYDPEKDADGSELEYVIMNALPVCANINLDYFTSRAFPEAFGSGSKLPLNIVSGIGLMTGSKSDLRIGLARQMVDQHEALRLLSFVFCKKEHLQNVIAKSARLSNLVKNEWIHLVRIDPVDFSMEPLTKEISDALN